MCSISGFYNSSETYSKKRDFCTDTLNNMNQSLCHRGPDNQGILITNKSAMAHTRLSIRDIKNGNQPMSINCFENSIHIIYNGEIYNSSELKSDLISKGYSFDTTSDTEVILACFLHFGPDFVNMLNGIFSFAIYDSSNETIYLYRDNFGIKPLYYTFTSDNTLVYASEIKALFKFPGICPVIDKNGLCQIFGIGPSKVPGSGVYKNIKEVKPGEFIKFSKYGLQTYTYYRITSKPHYDNYETTLKKTRELVTDSILRQTVSDVPVCTFLSGGIDSSIVTAVCNEKIKSEGSILSTYSFDFSGNDIYFSANAFQPERDNKYVDIMQKHLGTSHTNLICDSSNMIDMLYDSVLSRDLPTMADVDSSLLYFCKLVSEKEKVVLTGECADEIFGGYPWFYRANLVNYKGFPWMTDISPRLDIINKELAEYLNIPQFIKDTYESIVSEINMLPEENEIQKNRRQIGYINIKMFMQTLLDRMDRTSMYNGLEARVPYADTRIVDYIFNVPWEYKFKNNQEKSLLRNAFKGYIPDEVLFRKKSPYPKTYHPIYEKLLCKKLTEILTEGSPLLNLLDVSSVTEFLDAPKDYGKPWYGQLMAGPQMIAYLIQIHYWLTHYNISIEL